VTCTLCQTAPMLRGRKCAFGGNGRFRPDNWMCLTMLRLRDVALWRLRDDLHSSSIAVVLLPDVDDLQGYIVLTYDKDRGAVGSAMLVNSADRPRTLTLKVAEAAVRSLA
jgi:hypothetical protein